MMLQSVAYMHKVRALLFNEDVFGRTGVTDVLLVILLERPPVQRKAGISKDITAAYGMCHTVQCDKQRQKRSEVSGSQCSSAHQP